MNLCSPRGMPGTQGATNQYDSDSINSQPVRVRTTESQKPACRRAIRDSYLPGSIKLGSSDWKPMCYEKGPKGAKGNADNPARPSLRSAHVAQEPWVYRR